MQKAWLQLLADLTRHKECQGGYIFSQNGDRSKDVRNLGSKHLDNLHPLGIACFHGTFLGTYGLREGVYNQETVFTSREHPQGLIMTPINSSHFEVYHLWRHPFLEFINSIHDPNTRQMFLTQPPVPEFTRPALASEVR